MAVLFVVFCHVALMAPSLFVYEGTFLGCHFSSSHLHVSVSVPSHLPHLSATPTPFKPIATFPSIPSHPLMTDMPWTKNGETAAASWNGNRYRDASAPPPAVNVPRKYFTLSPLASFFILFLPLSRERCHFILSFEAIILCP